MITLSIEGKYLFIIQYIAINIDIVTQGAKTDKRFNPMFEWGLMINASVFITVE